jgi:hypothetical protein
MAGAAQHTAEEHGAEEREAEEPGALKHKSWGSEK